jgi:NAD(P)-dependent dehydrogenase (short-subunit alcohol dehydrogenase family)
MKAAGRGKILNIGSMYSLFGAPTVAAYAASKGGLVQLTRSLAAAWAPDNIQVNAILPGWVDTELTEERVSKSPGFTSSSWRAHPPAGGVNRMTSLESRCSCAVRHPILSPEPRCPSTGDIRHAGDLSMIFSQSRLPLFRIML